MNLFANYENLVQTRTMVPEGLTAAHIAFGVEPSLPIADISQALVSVAQIIDVAAIHRRQCEIGVAKMRVKTDLSCPSPSERFLAVDPRDQVLVFRENEVDPIGICKTLESSPSHKIKPYTVMPSLEDL